VKGKTMKYEIKYTEETWYRLEIEADSEEQARDKFFSGEWEEEPTIFGGELQDGISVEELEQVSA